MPIEDRIEQIAKLVLVIILVATLGWISHPKAQSAAQEAAQESAAPLILVGLWYVLESDSELVMRKSTEGLWEELVRRSERRANAI